MLTEVSAAVQTELDVLEPIDAENADVGALVLKGGVGRAYNEEAFQYFLENERKRSEISKRPFLLMLIDFKSPHGTHPQIDALADRLFSVLPLCLRETDFVGWYLEGRVAGAVLTQHRKPEVADLSEVARRRICAELEKHFLSDLARSLQVRVYGLAPNVNVQTD